MLSNLLIRMGLSSEMTVSCDTLRDPGSPFLKNYHPTVAGLRTQEGPIYTTYSIYLPLFVDVFLLF